MDFVGQESRRWEGWSQASRGGSRNREVSGRRENRVSRFSIISSVVNGKLGKVRPSYSFLAGRMRPELVL